MHPTIRALVMGTERLRCTPANDPRRGLDAPQTRRLGASALVFCLGATAPTATRAQDASEIGSAAARSPSFSLAFTLENDFFTGSDNDYTNGTGLTLQSAESRDYAPDAWPAVWMGFWSFLPHIGDESCLTYSAWTIGQELFTPEDITLSNPPEDDQPYAGVLFLDSSLYARNRRVTHAWNLRLGIAGPSALGEWTQSTVHSIVGADQPQGWDTQIPDEPILNLDYTVGYQWLSAPLSDNAVLRVVPTAGASLGNYFTGLSSGLYVELGWQVPPSISLLSIRRGLDPFIHDAPDHSRWSASLYAGAGWFGVAHYLPLDGTLLRDSPAVDSEPSVTFASAGVVVRVRSFTVGYLVTQFDDTFESQPGATDYGTLSISWSL